MSKEEQGFVAECIEDGFTVNSAKATVLREQSKENVLDLDAIAYILSGQKATENKPRRVKVSGELYSRFFKPEQSAKEVEVIVEEALLQYFTRKSSKSGENLQAVAKSLDTQTAVTNITPHEETIGGMAV